MCFKLLWVAHFESVLPERTYILVVCLAAGSALQKQFDKKLRIYVHARIEPLPWRAGDDGGPVRLRLAPSDRFSSDKLCLTRFVRTWVRRVSRGGSGLGRAGVSAEFKLSKRSCVWTSSCVNPNGAFFFVGMGETKAELQYLFSRWLRLLSLSSPAPLSRGLRMKHAVLLKEVGVYVFM